MVKQYSLKKHGNNKLSEHFFVREFKCKDGSDTILIDDALPPLLEKIRAHYTEKMKDEGVVSLIINSAYRTPNWNKVVGGKKNSQHLKGCAIDFVINVRDHGMIEPLSVYADLNGNSSTLTAGEGIFGIYKGGLGKYRGFTHIDVRGSVARWDGP